MERLTYKEGNHYYSENDCLVEISTIDEDSLNVLQNILDKLGNYEDAEEQGLLLRLPCKLGDTIYEVSYKNRKYIICEHIVNQFVYIAYRKPRIEIYCEGENGFLSSSITGQLDDGLFLSKEEAEAKLAEMEKKHEV